MSPAAGPAPAPAPSPAPAPAPARGGWRSAFERHEAPRAPWLDGLRRAAMEHFLAEGFPTPRHEDWLSTSLAPLEQAQFSPLPLAPAPVGCAAIDPVLRALPRAGRVVFVDGRLHAGLSAPLPAGVRVTPLEQALATRRDVLEPLLMLPPEEQEHPFVRLGTAFLGQGLLVEVEPGAALAEPLVLQHVRTKDVGPLALHPRTVVLAGERSRATVFESFVGLGSGHDLTNALTQVALAPGARLEHLRVQREGYGTSHVGLLKARVERDAALHAVVLCFGAALARLETDVALVGPGASAALDALYVLDGARRADLVSRVAHLVPHATSRQLVKGVLDGESRGAFTGRVRVAPGALKTDARQGSHNLLLSPRALVESRPQLEIDADDVKCSHGATVGRLDATALFYLRSRGIGEAQARQLLVHAFAAEVLSHLPDGLARGALDQVLAGGLHEAISPGRAP
ncbi:MAG: Fe-S cluster assembly protein SufD [Planctomycetia bacterium]